jgi:hypothetical protein
VTEPQHHQQNERLADTLGRPKRKVSPEMLARAKCLSDELELYAIEALLRLDQL